MRSMRGVGHAETLPKGVVRTTRIEDRAAIIKAEIKGLKALIKSDEKAVKQLEKRLQLANLQYAVKALKNHNSKRPGPEASDADYGSWKHRQIALQNEKFAVDTQLSQVTQALQARQQSLKTNRETLQEQEARYEKWLAAVRAADEKRRQDELQRKAWGEENAQVYPLIATLRKAPLTNLEDAKKLTKALKTIKGLPPNLQTALKRCSIRIEEEKQAAKKALSDFFMDYADTFIALIEKET